MCVDHALADRMSDFMIVARSLLLRQPSSGSSTRKTSGADAAIPLAILRSIEPSAALDAAR
jgi:hypothetical protein